MFHRSTRFTRRQQISAAVLALALALTMALPVVADPIGSVPDLSETDLGDLPDKPVSDPSLSYPTLLANNGPVHDLEGNTLWLGACVDGELDGLPDNLNDVDALADDYNEGEPIYPLGTPYALCPDDEDGVKRVQGKGGASNGGWTNGEVGTGSTGNGGAVEVTITGGPACLGAFFDFAHTGTTVAPVQLRNSAGSPVTQPILASVTPYTFYFDIDPAAFNGLTSRPIYARFRVTSPVEGSCASSTAFFATGPAPDGEVEDYRWNFGPNAVTLSDMTASAAATPLALPLGLVTLLGLLIGGIVLARRPV